MTYTCPVCGYPNVETLSSEGGAPALCPSCGFDFARADARDESVHLRWRFAWVADGTPFRAGGHRLVPPGWDPQRQLSDLVDGQYRPEPGATYTCPVCGYAGLAEEPRSRSGGGSYEICPSCGFEFGFTDDALGFSDRQWRAQWVADGMPWRDGRIQPPPPGWDPKRQLAAITGGN